MVCVRDGGVDSWREVCSRSAVWIVGGRCGGSVVCPGADVWFVGVNCGLV